MRSCTTVPEPEVRAGLVQLQAAELLYETRLVPDLEYTFKHALTHDVAYRGLLPDQRRALHARIADARDADRINAAVMNDPRIKETMAAGDHPFDPRRMAYGGFRTLVVA